MGPFGGPVLVAAEGRPAWAGPHETRGLERALEVGRGKKLGLHKRLDDGGEPPAPGRGPGSGRGHTSPAIEGPFRPQEFQLFFYHGDHLGSSNVVTDAFADVYEHLEYFPNGEARVDQGGTARLLPYKFTAKALDPETRLYHYGYHTPVVYTDPDGQLPLLITGSIGAGVTTLAYVGRSLYVGEESP